MNSIDHGGHRDRADHTYLCPLWSEFPGTLMELDA